MGEAAYLSKNKEDLQKSFYKAIPGSSNLWFPQLTRDEGSVSNLHGETNGLDLLQNIVNRDLGGLRGFLHAIMLLPFFPSPTDVDQKHQGPLHLIVLNDMEPLLFMKTIMHLYV
ncbi:hypothetical protein F2P56_008866 [Juglans regia]|uniref:Uncharacterized protein n=1 Tax=Juglans regia TaxID=51240 RepID=A0A833XW05_JUGRE|nr:hypothetical protein F2P56_008866 [Juglans regia]